MKFTAFFILVAALHVGARGLTQTVNLSVKNAPLSKVFEQVKKQTGYSFMWDEKILKGTKPVSLEMKNATIQQVMEACVKDQPITYAIIDNLVLVKLKTASPNADGGSEQLPPPVDIKGLVTDADGSPLPNASIHVRGTNIGTTTDANGMFTLKGVDENATLEISFVGYQSQTISVSPFVKTAGAFTVQLKRNDSPLDEIQIRAYGSPITKRLNPSNQYHVSANEIDKQPVNNVLLALYNVPGLTIKQLSGITNGAVTTRVQGQNSINGGLDPLIVIDGVPYPSQLVYSLLDGSLLGTNGGSPLSFINPSDIESIDILKDADATSIYGSRAANGAILITTKKGKAGRTRIDVSVEHGWSDVARKMKMLNTRQYLDMRYEGLQNDGIDINTLSNTNSRYYDLKVWDTTRYTDWQKTLIGNTAQFNNISASISGGTASIQYLFGANYRSETSVFPGDFDDKKGSVHFNLGGSTTNQKLRFQLSGNYMIDDNHLPNTDLTQYAIRMEPVAPALYNNDGTLNWAPNVNGQSTWFNPLIYTIYQDYSNTTKNLVSNASLSYSILPGLQVKSSFGYVNLQSNIFLPGPIGINRPEDRPSSTRFANYGNRTMNSWIVEPQISYSKNLSKGKIDALLGTTIQENRNNEVSLFAEGFNSDLVLKDITSATAISVTNAANSIYKYNALFGQVSYNLQNKYIINASGRRDGSSRFGDQNKFHNFGSIGAAWIFSQESFMQKNLPFISYGKLRGSFGTTGNDQINDYGYLGLYGSIFAGVPYQNISSLGAVRIPNPLLQWEETRKLQLGIDLGFLNDRILLNTSYARNRSSNLLLGYQLPSITGFPNITDNFPGTIQNSSWEFSLNTINVKRGAFSWTSNINLTIPKNKLIAFSNLASSSYANLLVIGQPVSVTKVFHFIGVDPPSGEYLFSSSNGTPTSNPSSPTDNTTLISTLPKFFGGFQNNISFKGFQVDVLFQFVKQLGFNYIYSNGNSIIPGRFSARSSNQPVTILDRWRKPGDNAPIMRYNAAGNLSSFFNVLSSDAAYQDASFIRLKNISISWSFPQKWNQRAKLQDCKLFFQGQNLATITKYKGLDPENQTVTNLPPLRVFTIGLKVGL